MASNTDSESSTTISKRNKCKCNHQAVLDSLGKRSTLLAHPHGVAVLEEYKKIKKDGLSSDETTLAEALRSGLQALIGEKETEISSKIRDVLHEKWSGGHTAGEKDEAVEGESQGIKVSGQPDLVLRVLAKKLVEKEGEEGREKEVLEIAMEAKGADETSKRLVAIIIEISADGNGGEKKHHQAYDYAKFATDKPEAFLFFVMHVDRKHTGSTLAIHQEAFIFCDVGANEPPPKYGLLWREFYYANSESEKIATLEQACQGIVRSIHCSTFLQQMAPHSGYWKTFHNNVAVEGTSAENKQWVYKIFDNRYLPTQRKPENWVKPETGLQQPQPWCEHLGVTEYLCYEEGNNAKMLLGKPLDSGALQANAAGRPRPSPRKKLKKGDKVLENMPYGNGAVVVIKYKYQNGTHIASRASHFLSIANSIERMHNAGMVHGDIRGHNLLHPSGKGGSIAESCLIDFDLSGKHEAGTYPVGLSSVVPENSPQMRVVQEGDVMKKEHDWKAFGQAMGVYVIRDKSSEANWSVISNGYYLEADSNDPTKAINDFIRKYDDPEIVLNDAFKHHFHEKEIKGTGSPEFTRGPRQRLSASHSASQEAASTGEAQHD